MNTSWLLAVKGDRRVPSWVHSSYPGLLVADLFSLLRCCCSYVIVDANHCDDYVAAGFSSPQPIEVVMDTDLARGPEVVSGCGVELGPKEVFGVR
uniref:Uncharacterized protein n=1 Tax=Nelumbo nucifera TaxID=4432 RepID=A0A822YWN9_NELNU|nr:TPA_asm: hypothetical protein HUJ06_007753 [Nelumbo nucifera]